MAGEKTSNAEETKAAATLPVGDLEARENGGAAVKGGGDVKGQEGVERGGKVNGG